MEKKTKHLEFVQNTITRMGVNSFLLKGWGVTLLVGLIALVSKEAKDIYFLLSFLILIFFWLLDSYYLLQERLFISLYNSVRQKEEKDIDFSMHTKDFCGGRNTWFECFCSKTEVVFYGSLLIINLITLSVFVK